MNGTADTPVLVLVTGSGLQDRDETLFEHKPFAVIADFFAREGIATLRYDDRGMGGSTGDLIQVTTEDLKNDARAGISLLQGRFKHVGVLGHSEGGSIAFMLAAERQADFIISLAGGILSGKAILLDQNRTLLLRQGISEDETEAYCAALSELFDRMILGQGLQNLDGVAISDALKANLAAVANQNSPYMQYFLQMDVSSLLDRVDCPVMAINGDRDTQVNAALNMPLLEQRFWADPRSCIKIYPELNHLFQHCVTGDVSEYKEIEETLSPEVLSDLVAWIRALRF
jgi:pimeloyl-ACP methyl ester carboxylesterase